MDQSPSEQPAPKRQRVDQNGTQDTTVMCWEHTSNIPSGCPPSTFACPFSGQFGQYYSAAPLDAVPELHPTSLWTTPDSFQQQEAYANSLYNQHHTRPVPIAPNIFLDYDIFPDSDVPSMPGFPPGTFMAFTKPTEPPVPLFQPGSSTMMPAPDIVNPQPINNQCALIEPAEPTIWHDDEVSQDLAAGAFVAPSIIDPDETVCFGVVGGVLGKCQRPSAADNPSPAEVTLNSSETFVISSDTGIQGHIASDHSFLLRDIIDSGVELRITCSFEADGPAKSAAARKEKAELSPCKLDIAIYAPFAMLEELREWSEHNEVYLQDPKVCLKDARYCNPQRLSLHFGEPCMVAQVVSSVTEQRLHLRDITEDDDFLDKYLGSRTDLQETDQPSAVKTPLKSYVNAVSEIGSDEPPPQLHGGIIADPMGLGKTLTMIALVATDLSAPTLQDSPPQDDEDEHKQSVSATLIIVPPPLLSTWESQILEHVFPNGLKMIKHHAKSRLTCVQDIQSVDVVLTTCHTVSSEWNEMCPSTSLLFLVKWKRIVLDEAHIIRNDTSRMAKAICALDSALRWAVTGTPIQNHLNDLATLLKFIRAHPYDTRSRFELDISNHWKEGRDKEAAARHQRLSSCLLLRRPKATVRLPPRHNKECPVEFTAPEREGYDRLRSRTETAIDEALRRGHTLGRSGAYVNILQQIESLRLFCGLGLHYHSRHDSGSLASHAPTTSWAAVAQQAFRVHLEMGSVQCSQCHAVIELTQSLLDDSAARDLLSSRCLRIACAECAARLARREMTMDCGHGPTCPTTRVSAGMYAIEEDVPDGEVPIPRHPSALPSKIAALVSDISSQPAHVKSIIFSTWRLTLNVAAAGLEQAGIQCLRFDGRVPQRDRHGILDRFSTDPLKRVLLLTLSCGAVGLTLTAASRAYLMEPHWNPTLEEQALGRIHRTGQDKEVTTIRFFIRDSFEQHVMDVQQSKKDLARVLLSPHDGVRPDDSLERLQKLRSLL